MPGKQAKEPHGQAVSLETKGPKLWHQIEESLCNLRQVTQPLSFLSVKWG